MLETAMLKVFATEHLWTIVNDTMQIYGGKAYFTDEPYERMMRDARINTIGEGANDVLKAFIAVVGCRGPGMQLDAARRNPFKHHSKLLQVGWEQSLGRCSFTRRAGVSKDLKQLATHARQANASNSVLPCPGCSCEPALKRSSFRASTSTSGLADIAIDLYASACTLSRLDHLLQNGNGSAAQTQAEVSAGRYFMKYADRRIGNNFAALRDNDDAMTTACADSVVAANS